MKKTNAILTSNSSCFKKCNNFCINVNWTMSWDHLFMPYVNNKGTGQSAHLCSLICAIDIRCISGIIIIVTLSKISRLLFVCVAEQAGLVLPSTSSEDRISYELAQLRIHQISFSSMPALGASGLKIIPVFPLTRPTLFFSVPTLQFLWPSRKKLKDFHTY